MSPPALRRRPLPFSRAHARFVLSLLGSLVGCLVGSLVGQGPTLLLLASLSVAAACGERDPHAFFQARKRPMIFAHRGGGGLAPEATLPTLLEAQARDPEAIIEFDVHRSRDGHIVVIHDDTVDRTTNGTGRVADLTLAELQALDAGFCATPGVGNGTAQRGTCPPNADPAMFPFRGQGRRIPTLAEVLAALPPQTPLSIEVKAAGFEKQFAEAMRSSGRLERLVVGAEHDEISVRLQDLLPELPHFMPTGAAKCLALTAKLRLDYPACPEYGVFASPLTGAGLALDTKEVLEAAHDRGTVVVYWTINEEAEMERLFRLGADGIFTDYPDRARRVLDRLRTQGVLP